MHTRANYTTVYIGAQLAADEQTAEETLDLDWATSAGDETDEFEFTVTASNPLDAYVGLQAFDVGGYGHEILINGESLSGFSIPPNDGWQYWADTITGATLHEGTNTIQFRRDTESDDAFAVGTVTVHWKEHVDE